MKKLLIGASATAVILSSTAAFAETRTLDTGAFSGVDIASGITANVTVGSAPSVVADAPSASDFELFKYEVRSGVLHVWFEWSIFRVLDFSDRKMVLTISVPDLNYLEASSGAHIVAAGLGGDSLSFEASSGANIVATQVAGSAYQLNASSGANLTLDGTCAAAKADTSSGSSINASGLMCETATLDASSGARIEIAVSESLTADVSSGGNANVHGRPRVESLNASSGGTVNFVE